MFVVSVTKEELTVAAVVEQVIIFCPVCCSPLDAAGTEGESVEMDCGVCGQVFTLPLSPARVAQHGMN